MFTLYNNANTFTYEKISYYAKIEDEFGELRNAPIEHHEEIKNNMILDICKTYEGISILTTKPAGICERVWMVYFSIMPPDMTGIKIS